jgi:hypothetical protein
MCHSELTREFATPVVRMVQKILARPAEVGARTIVHGAGAGPESHGQYIPDCKIETPMGICQKEDTTKVQKVLWKELKAKIEGIQHGATNCISA